jgi:IMP dehydrogenase
MKIERSESLTYDDISIIPSYSNVLTRDNCDTSVEIGNYKLGIPLLASPMDTVCGTNMCIELARLGGLGVLHRFQTIQEQVEMCYDIEAEVRQHYMASIGVGQKGKDRFDSLVGYTNVQGVCIDVAHGDHILVEEMIKYIKEEFDDVHVLAGNIVTIQAAERLIKAGADSLRVGIGNGSMCETRIRAGVGVPQATAINEIYQFVNNTLEEHTHIIADGGCKTVGDIPKAIALGADAVMVGSLFAGTKETPGIISKMGQWPNEQLYKKYQGSASIDSNTSRGEETKNVEGNSKITPYKGKVRRIVQDISDGVKSSMSYVGAYTIDELQNNARFCRVTEAGQLEAKPHGLY